MGGVSAIILILTLFWFSNNSASIEVSKQVVANRIKYSKEIIQATNECIAKASSIKELTVSGNDQGEVVIACVENAQIVYGAYSPFFESKLLKWSVQ